MLLYDLDGLIRVLATWYSWRMETQQQEREPESSSFTDFVWKAWKLRQQVPARERAGDMAIGATVTFVGYLAITGQLSSLF